MNPRDTMSLEEVAKLIGVAPEKVIPLLEGGDIPAKLVDGRWLVSKTGFEGWRLNTAGIGSVLRVWGAGAPTAGSGVSIEEAAKILGMKPEEVGDLVRRGVLPALQQQGRWSIGRNSLEIYLAKHKPAGAKVPQGWQSKKPAGGGGGLAAAAAEAGALSRGPQPAGRLVNEPVTMTPASLELDLSILDQLEIPDAPVEEYEDGDDAGGQADDETDEADT